jgi:tetratricopeptide (TPR) repeat protein
MIDYNARLSAAILGVGVALVQIQPAQALTKVEVSKVAQSVTVMIQDPQSPQTAGSGIIIKREGETYTVLTAHHVVKQSPDYKVMTPDKKMNPIMQGSIKPLPGVDLALVQFKSAGSYGIAKMGDSTQSPSGSASFVAGFPANSVNTVMSEPEYYFTSGEIAANGSRPNKDGYALAYSNPTLRGMSGGPVLNEQGELIGIHGRAERAEKLQNSQLSDDTYVLKTEFNYAIPINTFLTLVPQVNKTLALRTPSPSVSSAPKADDFFLQADTKLNNRDYKGALVDYDQAIRINPNFSNAYLGRASARSYLEDKQGAMDDLNQAIRVNPNNVLAYAERGISRVFEDSKAAEADLKKALSLNIDTKDAVTYRRRGQLRFGLGDEKGAIADFDQALRINPNFAKAYRNRGMARTKLDDVHGAIADCFQALHINPKDSMADFCITEAPQGEWNRKNIIAYDQALQRYPNSAIVYYHRGRFRSRLGDKKGAIADYNQAIRINPNYDLPYSARGRIRLELGDKKGTIADYGQVIRLNPKSSSGYFERGKVRFDLGDKQGAASDFQQAAAISKRLAASDDPLRLVGKHDYQDALKWLQRVNSR